MTVTYQANGHSLEIEREEIEVTSALPYPDPKWRATDSNGHEHAWVDGGYPTLTWVVDQPAFAAVVEDGYLEEYPEEGHYECTVCGDVVRPGATVDAFRRFIPGVTRYYLDGAPITRDEAEAFMTSQQPQP